MDLQPSSDKSDILHVRRNLALDFVRATEAAALSAAREMGTGVDREIDHAATREMLIILNTVNMDGRIVLGEEGKYDDGCDLETGRAVGTGAGPAMDVVVDPIDGRRLLGALRPGALAVGAVAPRGTMWAPKPAIYMEKLVVDSAVAPLLVEECLDAPVGWTLGLIARAKDKPVSDLVVFVLDRPRHTHLIAEIHRSGARVMQRLDGDLSGALHAAMPERGVDLLIGTGGVQEGILAACAVKALNGAMLGRLRPQSTAEREAVLAHGHDLRRILTQDDMVAGEEIYFAATAITDGPILRGVRHERELAHTHSLILRCETKTRRTIEAEHRRASPHADLLG